MLKHILYLSIFITLTACDPIVFKIKTSEPIVVTKSISCSYAGYCYACGVGVDGKYKCSYGRKRFCSGSQQAEFQETMYLYTRESGEKFHANQSVILKKLTSCR